MDHVIEWHDEPLNLQCRKVLTSDDLNISGLSTIGYHYSKKATSPLPLHYHKNCIEITYLLKGTLTFFVDDIPYKLYGGDIFFTAPNVIHTTGNNPLGICEIYWIQLDLSNPNTFLEVNSHWGKQLSQDLLAMGTGIIKQNITLAPLIKTAFDNLCSRPPISFIGLSHLITFLHQLVQNSAICCNAPISVDISSATDYICSHVTENLNLNYIASLSNLSLSRFKQKFTAEVGISPREFINIQKIELAKKLLLTNPNITDIALEIGFSSSSYFSVVFKQFTGLSPREYVKSFCKM
ncbi:MAG: AraC family transcriptional regulator [Cellulosilyticaceae bacterium]